MIVIKYNIKIIVILMAYTQPPNSNQIPVILNLGEYLAFLISQHQEYRNLGRIELTLNGRGFPQLRVNGNKPVNLVGNSYELTILAREIELTPQHPTFSGVARNAPQNVTPSTRLEDRFRPPSDLYGKYTPLTLVLSSDILAHPYMKVRLFGRTNSEFTFSLGQHLNDRLIYEEERP